MRKEEIDSFLNAFQKQLSFMPKEAKNKEQRERIVIAITLLSQLKYADNYQISQTLLDCADNALHQYKDNRVLVYIKSSLFGRPKTTEQDTILLFFDELKKSFDNKAISDLLYSNKSEVSLLQARIEINLYLEQIAADFDLVTNKIQEALNKTSNNFNLLLLVQDSTEIRPLSHYLLQGAKMQYCSEENRDDRSTKLLDNYKILLAETINPDLIKNAVTRHKTALNKIETKNTEMQQIVPMAKQLILLEQQSGNCVMFYDSLKSLKQAIGDKDRFELLLENFNSLQTTVKESMPERFWLIIDKAKDELVQLNSEASTKNSDSEFKN